MPFQPCRLSLPRLPSQSTTERAAYAAAVHHSPFWRRDAQDQGATSFLVHRGLSPACVLRGPWRGEQERALWPHLLLRALNPSRAPPSRPHLALVTSQRPHFLTPSPWELGLQHRDFGETQTFSPYLSNRQWMLQVWGLPGGPVVHLPASAGDASLTPGSGRSSRVGGGTPLQHSCLKNPVDGGAWRATVREVAKIQTQLKQLSTRILRVWNWVVTSGSESGLGIRVKGQCVEGQPERKEWGRD